MGYFPESREEAAQSIPMRYSAISHFIHPQHTLRFETAEFPFKCDGCKEVGIGSRYKCTSCDFDLHMHCAIPTPTISHPFKPKCSFQFLSRPPGDVPRYCNVCEKDVSGFVYHCRACGFDFHPCCAKLPMTLDDGRVQLLYRKVGEACNLCGRKGRSWSYRSMCNKYKLHVACVREMLVATWPDIYRGGGKGINSRPPARIPRLNYGAVNGNGKSKKDRYREFVVSAVLGDPTALVAGVIGEILACTQGDVVPCTVECACTRCISDVTQCTVGCGLVLGDVALRTVGY